MRPPFPTLLTVGFLAHSAFAQGSQTSLERVATELPRKFPNASATTQAGRVTATIDLGTTPWWMAGSRVAFMEPFVAAVLAANDDARTSLHLVVIVRGEGPVGDQPPDELFSRCDRASRSAWGWLAKNLRHQGQVTWEVRCLYTPRQQSPGNK